MRRALFSKFRGFLESHTNRNKVAKYRFLEYVIVHKIMKLIKEKIVQKAHKMGKIPQKLLKRQRSKVAILMKLNKNSFFLLLKCKKLLIPEVQSAIVHMSLTKG